MGSKQLGNGCPMPGSKGAEPRGPSELSAWLLVSHAATEQVNMELLYNRQVNI